MWTREGAVPIPVLLVLVLLARPEPAAGAPAAVPQPALPTAARIVLLHHSTGECVWNGGVPQWFAQYNEAHGTRYTIAEQAFPKDSPYGWENYPYDYWNIWVRHAGPRPFKEEPTLEMLTPRYDVIVLKHCFPVSQIEADTGTADAASSDKRLENYKLQYAALKKKMRQFPKTRFLVWTGAALVLHAPIGVDWESSDQHHLGMAMNINRALLVRRSDPDDQRGTNDRLIPLPGFYYRWRR